MAINCAKYIRGGNRRGDWKMRNPGPGLAYRLGARVMRRMWLCLLHAHSEAETGQGLQNAHCDRH